jgi:hypothetical protein
MDRVSESLLNEFCDQHGLSLLTEEKKFEHFVAFITIGQHYGDSFDTEDVLVGAATGIDAIATIVNGNLITDVESLEEADAVGELDVTFIIVQADRGAGFDAAKIGNFGFAALDFFSEQPTLPRTPQISAAANIMSEIYKRSTKFKRGNPICRLYYVTTGKWTDDTVLDGRRKAVISDLEATNLFRQITFVPLGAEGIQRLYRQTKNAISREFFFKNHVVIPELPGVTQAYIGYLPMPEFIKLLADDNGEIIGSLFYSNPRDWQDYNEVNLEIKSTLASDAKRRFVLMNNGITIIAREIRPTGQKFVIEDYQIVNGCQTSHVLIQQAKKDDESVMVPIRLIGTQDEDVINSIIRATNRQTQVTEDQFFALQEFPKQLELFFQSFPLTQRLYFERRSRQYDRLPIEKTRIITQPNVIKAFAAMFLNEAHRTTRNYSSLKAKVGKDIFGKEHRMEPYYTAAVALYRLEYLFRNGKVPAQFKPARFHILQAVRLLASSEPLPATNSHAMEKYCRPIMNRLWEPMGGDGLLTQAVSVVEAVAAGDFDRDRIRTESFTGSVTTKCREISEGTKEAVPHGN